MTHPADLALQQAHPLIPVPRFGALEPLTANGHRFLAAANGMFVEIRRPWIHAIQPIAPMAAPFAVPYGKLDPVLTLAFEEPPQALFYGFLNDVVEAFPKETGGCITLNAATGEMRYRKLEAIEARIGYFHYKMPTDLTDDEHVVFDLHSHGPIPAFFSSEDDRDDRGAYKIAGVIGQVGDDTEWQFRLCLGGIFIPILPPRCLRAGETATFEDI